MHGGPWRWRASSNQTELVALHVLAGVLLELGQPEASWTFSERLVALTAEAGDAYVESNTRLNALLVALDRPHLIDMDPLDYARQSLVVAERGENPYAAVGFRCAIAQLSDDVPALQACLAEGRELDDPAVEAMVLRDLALREPEREAANALLDEAAPLGEESRFVKAQIAHARAAVAWRFGDVAGSEEASREAVRIVTEMRDEHREELARAGYATVWRPAWEAPEARALAAGDLAKAWSWSEAMRGQVQRAAEGRAEAVPSLAEVQPSLADDEALVAYVFPTERIGSAWAWVVRADRVDTVPIDAVGLAQRVDVLLGMGRPPPQAVGALRSQVWTPLEPLLDGVARVRVVPDGPLHRFPVAALLTAATDPVMSRTATSTPVQTSDAQVEGVRSLVAPTGTELPASRAEGEAWVAAFGGALFAEDAADPEALVGPEGVLHVASHAQVERWVGLPRLQLAGGWVDTEQVAALPLDGKVGGMGGLRGLGRAGVRRRGCLQPGPCRAARWSPCRRGERGPCAGWPGD